MGGDTDFRMRVLVEGNADAAVQAIVPGLKQIEAAAKGGTAAVGAGSRQNLQVMQDMGRVIQDMPYGINGIANNIQPLIESFNRSKEAAGGTSQAVAVLLSSIASPMGLAMVGIPIVTSLAVAFGSTLVSAVAAGSESIDKLKERLTSIGGYKDFTLEVKIAGLEGLAKLEAQLLRVQNQQRYLMGSAAVDKKVATAEPTLLQKILGAGSEGGSSASQNLYAPFIAAKKEQSAYYKSFVANILAQKGSTGSVEGDANLLIEWGKYEKKSSYRAAEMNAKVGEVRVLQGSITLQKQKDQEKTDKKGLSAAKAGDAAALKADRLDQSWAQAILEADKALGKIGQTALPSIEVATARVAKAAEAVTKAEQLPETILNEKALRTATTELTQAQGELKGTTTAYDSAVKNANMALAKSGESTKDVAGAHADVIAAEGALTEVMKLGSKATADIVKKTDELTLARTVEGKAMDALRKKSDQLSKVFKGVGEMAALFGLNGQGVTGLLEGVSGLSASSIQERATKENVSTAQAAAEVYAGIGQSLGAVVGGKVGAGISNVASGALTGFTVANVPGAIVGGLIGLAGSIFGGGNSSAQDMANNRASGYDSIKSAALSGGRASQGIFAQYGYSQAGADAYYSGMGVAGIKARTDFVLEADKAIAGIESFNSTSVVGKLQDINAQFNFSVQTIGELANQAKLYEQILAITGVTADSIGQLIADAVNADTTGSAGKAFADKFEESIAVAIKNMAISNLVNSSIMPVLEPVMSSLVSGLMAGTLTTSGMASMFAGVKVVADQLQPIISALSQSFVAAGLGGTSSAISTVSAGGYSSLAAYRMAQAGIPAFASGGTFIAGDAGPEIVRISAGSGARIYSNGETRGLLDNSQVVAGLNALLDETRAGNYAIAKSTQRMAQWIEKWEKDGLPATTTAP